MRHPPCHKEKIFSIIEQPSEAAINISRITVSKNTYLTKIAFRVPHEDLNTFKGLFNNISLHHNDTVPGGVDVCFMGLFNIRKALSIVKKNNLITQAICEESLGFYFSPRFIPKNPIRPVPPTVSEAISELSRFNSNRIISEIIHTLQVLELAPDNRTVAPLREKLNKFYYDSKKHDIKKEGFSLHHALYNTLLALAELMPINDTDFATHKAIEAEHRITLSSGHQCDIRSLVDHHNTRGDEGSTLNEFFGEKWLLNPYLSNTKCNTDDVTRAITFATSKQLTIKHLKKEATTPLMMSQSMFDTQMDRRKHVMLSLLNHMLDSERSLDITSGGTINLLR